MVELYYYVPTADIEYVVSCGLKLSKWGDKEVIIDGDRKKCLSALLNPKDDIESYKSDNLTCVKLEVQDEYCFISDKLLYLAGMENSSIMDLYHKSITPVKDYIFGTLRLPECLITCTIIEGYISVLNKAQDSPILFGDTEELYLNNIFEGFREKNDHFNDALLYCFLNKLTENGIMDMFVDPVRNIAVFNNRGNNNIYTLRIPDFNQFNFNQFV